ncbi:peptidoglycan D,D-transpeptidase FtsI family protein [Chitinasiproducens palmae]|uniref:Peptidoglycan D,D-transpeptidase FtsI n=1 Tax=Chitinasiproducens palmae TaxID=1770053 RepID=A0A1H2PNY7_9BURK|nr:penicillin-binding protein 2 [Chitinasiproducens palmae]SDV48440.1 peptidoglycan synthetase FtsI [Chitinasiproducens palmae]
MKFGLHGQRGISFSSSAIDRGGLPPWRSRVVVFVVTVLFASLGARAFWVQVGNNQFYSEQGRKRVQRTIEVPAARGRIVDRDNRLLAMSQRAAGIFADPTEVPSDLPAETRARLAGLLGMSPADLAARLDPARSFVFLARQLPYERGEEIAALKIPGIYRQPEWQRVYPMGESAAHVVGFTGLEGQGQEGIELALNQQLLAQNGQRLVIRDRLGRVVEDRGLLRSPRDGAAVQLTIDSRLQHLAYSELRAAVERHGAKAGGAVVLDARTGEILALANWPSYEPNQRSKLRGEQLRNRVVTDLFEPGSTIKPLNVALALDRGMVRPGTVVDTLGGSMKLGGGYTVKDVSRSTSLSVADVLKKSSNVGMVQIMHRVPSQEMWLSFQRFGLGHAPSVAFPGTAAGWVRPAARWKPIEHATMSYGYGLSVSLLQMAQAYTVFAGDGAMRPVSLLSGQPGVPQHVVRPETARAVRDMLELAAAKASAVEGYRVGGKSGTTRKLVGGRYGAARYLSNFIGIAPLSNPRIVVAVTIDDPTKGGYYGGAVAAPVFSDIAAGALHLLGVAPDLHVQPLAASASATPAPAPAPAPKAALRPPAVPAGRAG